MLAESRRTLDKYRYLRVYPPVTAEMFSDITGYYATAVQANPFGIEASYDQYLSQHETPIGSLHDLLSQHAETDDVILTASERLQAVAMEALDSQTEGQNGGAVIALDPRDGDILAMYSNPAYDPNLFSVHNPVAVNALASKYNSLPNQDNPLFNNAIEALHPPGSTFKVITTSAIYDHDPALATRMYPVESFYTFANSGNPPKTIHNYDYEECGGALATVLARSCDTAFSQIGNELGASSLALEAQSFGFGSVPPIDLPGAVASQFPPASAIDAPSASPYLGYSAIGQYDDAASALQMALVAAAIADNGTIMAPHLVSKVVGSDGQRRVRLPAARLAAGDLGGDGGDGPPADDRASRQWPTAPPTASFGVLLHPGYPTAAAKTGTAEPGGTQCGTYNWLLAMAPAGPGQTPSVVVAAMVPVLSSLACSIDPTGASVAGPVALAVLQAALQPSRR